MSRYPTNTARRSSPAASYARGRTDSFQGRSRGINARRGSGAPSAQLPGIPQSAREAADLADLAVETLFPEVSIPVRLFKFINFAMDAYQAINYLDLQNQGRTPSAWNVDAGIWNGPQGACSSNTGYPAAGIVLGGGTCGEEHLTNDAHGNTDLSDANFMSFMTDVGPGPSNTFIHGFYSFYERITNASKPQYGVIELPGVAPLADPRLNPWPQLNPWDVPVQVPGSPAMPDGKPVPWSVAPYLPNFSPVGEPLRGYDPKPLEETVPLVNPPVVFPNPIPGGRPITLTGLEPGTEVVVRPGRKPVTRPSQHENKPPKTNQKIKTKERKLIMSIKGSSWAGFVLSAVTESDDFLDDLWNAIPWSERKAWNKKRFWDPKSKKWKFAHISEKAKLHQVWTYQNKIDMKQAIRNVVADQLQDMLFGRLGRINAKAQRNVHDAGYGEMGPRNLGSPSRISNHSQIPDSGSAVAHYGGEAIRNLVNRWMDLYVPR